ncbi:hypothetical protein [Fodinicola feengrottensis]|nr:hypothetical protein [Fodinicola feengrottensis]
MLKPLGVPVGQIGRQVDGKFINRRGPSYQDIIQAAITRRDQNKNQ